MKPLTTSAGAALASRTVAPPSPVARRSFRGHRGLGSASRLLLPLVALLASGPAVGGVLSQPVEIELTTGEVLRGVVLERTESGLTLSHPVLGTVNIAASAIAAERPIEGAAGPSIAGGSPADEGSAAGPDAEGGEEAAAPAETPPAPVEPEVKWESQFDAGFSVSTGNTDTQEFTVGVNSLREAIRITTKFDARYFYGASNGDRDTNKATAGLINDWRIDDSRWSYFISGRFDYDEFQSWEYRASLFTGFGYDLIRQEDLNLKLRAGIGATKEFHSQRNQIIPEALLGAELDWTINDRQRLTASTTLFPDLDETGEFRVTSAASWVLALNQDRNMSLTLGLLNEYQSRVDPGIENNDLKIFGAFGFTF